MAYAIRAYATNRLPDPAWIGPIPSHWEVKKLKYTIAALESGVSVNATDLPAGNEELGVLKTSCVYTGEFRASENKTVVPEELGRVKCPVREQAIIISRMNTPDLVGASGLVTRPHDNLFLPDRLWQTVFRSEADVAARYVAYFLGTEGFRKQVSLAAEGASSSMQNVAKPDFLAIATTIPPLEEQTQIAKFLDYETAKIDALIEKQRQLIALLKEKREGLLHVAISEKGAEKVRLEHCWERVSRPISRLEDEIYYPIGLLNRGRGIFHKDPTLGCDLGDSDFFYVEEGDLILSGQFAWEGAVALAGEEESGCVATHRYPIVRGRPGVTETAFLWALFASQTGDFLLNESSRGAAGRNRPLNMNSLSKEKILVPSLGAQRAVAKLVFREKALRARIQQPIAFLQERRTALISAAVTGKIDVSDWKRPESETEAEVA